MVAASWVPTLLELLVTAARTAAADSKQEQQMQQGSHQQQQQQQQDKEEDETEQQRQYSSTGAACAAAPFLMSSQVPANVIWAVGTIAQQLCPLALNSSWASARASANPNSSSSSSGSVDSSSLSSTKTRNSSSRRGRSRQHTYISFLQTVGPDAHALLLLSMPVLCKASSRELAMLMWGAGCLKLSLEPSWAASFLRASYYQLPSFQLHEKAMLLLSLARCRVRPPAPWLAAFFEVAATRSTAATGAAAAAAEREEEGVGSVGWVQSGLQDLNGEGSLAAGARDGVRVAGRGMRPIGRQANVGVLGGVLPAQELGMVLWACGSWRYRPSPSWVAGALEGAVPHLHRSSPVHVGMMVRGLSKLMYRPSQEVLSVLMKHMKENLHAHR